MMLGAVEVMSKQHLDSGYILNVEPMGFVERLDMGCEKKTGSKVISELLA